MIVALRPSGEKLVGYRAAVVFDIADTAGNPLPSLTQFEGNPGEYLERLKSLVSQSGCALEYSTQYSSRARAMLGWKDHLVAGPGCPPRNSTC